ncbi:hypothetical protein B0T22DRAFT_138339 [Podospora appendiculata]|uniref:Uncharacterized protein n=1 Tax=Podospora appendiculata TaxID=314037 RepID=A0AAE0X809_9PEZI|nr:hypothetical protein B0T22DRAFT_138339 [Podospora appendiculata]
MTIKKKKKKKTETELGEKKNQRLTISKLHNPCRGWVLGNTFAFPPPPPLHFLCILCAVSVAPRPLFVAILLQALSTLPPFLGQLFGSGPIMYSPDEELSPCRLFFSQLPPCGWINNVKKKRGGDCSRRWFLIIDRSPTDMERGREYMYVYIYIYGYTRSGRDSEARMVGERKEERG